MGIRGDSIAEKVVPSWFHRQNPTIPVKSWPFDNRDARFLENFKEGVARQRRGAIVAEVRAFPHSAGKRKFQI